MYRIDCLGTCCTAASLRGCLLCRVPLAVDLNGSQFNFSALHISREIADRPFRGLKSHIDSFEQLSKESWLRPEGCLDATEAEDEDGLPLPEALQRLADHEGQESKLHSHWNRS